MFLFREYFLECLKLVSVIQFARIIMNVTGNLHFIKDNKFSEIN